MNSQATLDQAARIWRTVLCGLLIQGLVLAIAPVDARAAPRYAAMAVDAHSGKVLFSRNGDAKRYPASLTKIMTLYMVFEALREGRLDRQAEERN